LALKLIPATSPATIRGERSLALNIDLESGGGAPGTSRRRGRWRWSSSSCLRTRRRPRPDKRSTRQAWLLQVWLRTRWGLRGSASIAWSH